MRKLTKVAVIETDRLVMREPRAGDFETYRAFSADAKASAAYGGPLDEAAAWRMIATDIGHWVMRGYGRWEVIDKASEKMVGGCGLWWPEGWLRVELTW